MLAIGLMSGTSCDGVDAALIETDGESIHEFIAEYHLPYPIELQTALSNLMHTKNGWFELENQLTYHHAQAVKHLLGSIGIKQPEVLGFHGQSIFHAPMQGVCWQIGNPHLLASLTEIDVVSDFRRRDVAHGGQGAPLVPIFHQAIMKDHKRPVALVNIGGVANVTYIGEGSMLLGYDLGPGNALINDAMMRYYNMPYDKDGIIAKSGKVDHVMLKQFMSDEFFNAPPPKSLDRNHFTWVMELLKTYKHQDAIATLTMFTAKSIAKGLSEDYLQHVGVETPGVLYLCGGGGKNKALTEALQDEMPKTRVIHVEEIGMKSDFIEAQAFAYLAVRCLKNLPSSFPATTGVSRATVSGVHFRV